MMLPLFTKLPRAKVFSETQGRGEHKKGPGCKIPSPSALLRALLSRGL
jgi:hypothetical protein